MSRRVKRDPCHLQRSRLLHPPNFPMKACTFHTLGHPKGYAMAKEWRVPAEHFIIRGDLGVATFIPWVLRHMGKLGLKGGFGTTDRMQAELYVDGPQDLIDALEMGVSLGPIEAWVESIERRPLNRAA